MKTANINYFILTITLTLNSFLFTADFTQHTSRSRKIEHAESMEWQRLLVKERINCLINSLFENLEQHRTSPLALALLVSLAYAYAIQAAPFIAPLNAIHKIAPYTNKWTLTTITALATWSAYRSFSNRQSALIDNLKFIMDNLDKTASIKSFNALLVALNKLDFDQAKQILRNQRLSLNLRSYFAYNQFINEHYQTIIDTFITNKLSKSSNSFAWLTHNAIIQMRLCKINRLLKPFFHYLGGSGNRNERIKLFQLIYLNDATTFASILNALNTERTLNFEPIFQAAAILRNVDLKPSLKNSIFSYLQFLELNPQLRKSLSDIADLLQLRQFSQFNPTISQTKQAYEILSNQDENRPNYADFIAPASQNLILKIITQNEQPFDFLYQPLGQPQKPVKPILLTFNLDKETMIKKPVLINDAQEEQWEILVNKFEALEQKWNEARKISKEWRDIHNQEQSDATASESEHPEIPGMMAFGNLGRTLIKEQEQLMEEYNAFIKSQSDIQRMFESRVRRDERIRPTLFQ